MDFHRRLEHRSRPYSAYFVTWRLDGSLPVTRVTDFWTSDGPKFVELDQLLDAVSTGPRWLERRDVAGVVVSALLKGVRESRYELDAWVLMPNHVHIALRSLGDQDLASTVKSIKGSSAHAANRLLNRTGSRFWAKDYFDRRIRDREHEGRVTRYIENNPVKAGLCDSVQDWPRSSAAKNAA
jgi:REP element-mobilizing transposase RayT